MNHRKSIFIYCRCTVRATKLLHAQKLTLFKMCSIWSINLKLLEMTIPKYLTFLQFCIVVSFNFNSMFMPFKKKWKQNIAHTQNKIGKCQISMHIVKLTNTKRQNLHALHLHLDFATVDVFTSIKPLYSPQHT